MIIAMSPSKETALTQSRFTPGPQSVCLHSVNIRPKGPRYGDTLARGPPNRTRSTLDHSAPSLSSQRPGVRHTQSPRMQSPIAAETMALFQP